MSTLKVLTGNTNTVLRKTAKPVQKEDKSITKLIQNMQETMKKENGIGLAAPQVGVEKRVILATIGKKVTPMINPEITSFSAECNADNEGCLSLPEKFGKVSRSTRVTLEYQNEKGEKCTHKLSHLDARVVQHEIDHLNGILFTDRIIEKSSTPLEILSHN